MKSVVIVLLVLLWTAGAGYAQGKVCLANDTLSPIVLGPSGSILSADNALANQPIPTTGPLPSGKIITVGLYGSSSPDNLVLQGKVDLNPVGGTGYDTGSSPRPRSS